MVMYNRALILVLVQVEFNEYFDLRGTVVICIFFFFQAEDGIRDYKVTGVQTCALPIWFKRPYTELVYLPMLELLAYLRANGFRTFIASGGGIEFMRPWTERIYGVPPEQVIGSSIKTRYEMRDGTPVLFRLPEINFIDDKTGKPIGINEHIGRRPIAPFGNSDRDLEMLQCATLGASGARFGLIVHHTDAEREYAYDRQSHFGKLDVALDAAAVNRWTVVDMKKDWKRIFQFEP